MAPASQAWNIQFVILKAPTSKTTLKTADSAVIPVLKRAVAVVV